MHKIRPIILFGIGPQAQQTVTSYMQYVRTRQGNIPAILPVILRFSANVSPFRRESGGIQHLTLSPPVFEQENEWPTWLPEELDEMHPTERERARAWMRVAMLQGADELQEFLLASIPHLSSFAAVEEMSAAGVSLVGDSTIGIYVIADLGDHLGSSISVDVAYLTYYVCRQLGLQPTTTGLFYLPSATSPAPAEEAIAYAALKELEYYFDKRSYNGEFAPDWAATENRAPFEDGCYLVDNVNELGYTLEDPSQQISAMSEWLYAMTLLDMQGAVRQHRQRRYLTSTLRGKVRAYESFGVAIRYVPQVPLLDWATARQGHRTIERILNAPSDGNPEKHMRAFIARMGLSVDALSGRLRQQAQEHQIEEALTPLRRARLNQIESLSRQVLQAIRGQHLLVLDRNLSEAGRRAQNEVRQAIREETRATLQDTLLGGIPSAHQFLEMLREHVGTLQKETDELSKQQRMSLKRSLSTISRTYYTLRSVSMNKPPWPITALSVVFLIVLPLFYELELISRVIRSVDQMWSRAAVGILVAGILGVLGLVASRLWRQRRLVSKQHENMVRERFELESKPLLNREMKAVYGAMQQAIQEAEDDLEPLTSQLQAVASHFQSRARQAARELERLSAPGPFRSVVDLEQAERFYARVAPDTGQFIEAVTERIGSTADWLAYGVDSTQPLSAWLSDQISWIGSQYLESSVRELNALDVMQDTDQSEIHRNLQRMFGDAHPLWNYDPRALRRAKTQRMTLLGIDTLGSTWANVVGPLSQMHPDIIVINTGNPLTVAALRVHRGMPLFALRRMGEYRVHYAEMLWHSKLPVHTMRSFALVDDLVPVRRRTRLPTVTLFAAGLALGSISRDTDGRYLAPIGKGQTIRLSVSKERAVALMSMNAVSCREVQRQLDALVVNKGRQAVRTILDEYVTVIPDLEDWEVRSILDFGRAYQLDAGS